MPALKIASGSKPTAAEAIALRTAGATDQVALAREIQALVDAERKKVQTVADTVMGDAARLALGLHEAEDRIAALQAELAALKAPGPIRQAWNRLIGAGGQA